MEVTDPAHPLCGRRFRVHSAARSPDGHVFVEYRDGIVLRIPRAATSLSTFGQYPVRGKLSRSAIEELLSLVKEYELCPTPTKSPRAKSGRRFQPRTSKKSSKN